MDLLLIISLILILTFAGWWWISLILLWLNSKSSKETGWEKYLGVLYERYKKSPEEMGEVPDAVILAVKRRIQDSKDFYPLTCNPSAEIEVITLIHEQGSVALTRIRKPLPGTFRQGDFGDIFLSESPLREVEITFFDKFKK